MLQDFSPQGSRDETGQEVITLQEESQELMVQQVTVQQQVTAQQQVTVQEGQEKKASFSRESSIIRASLQTCAFYPL